MGSGVPTTQFFPRFRVVYIFVGAVFDETVIHSHS
jgi:hypothetical protein